MHCFPYDTAQTDQKGINALCCICVGQVQLYAHGEGISPFQRKVRLVSGIVASLLALGFAYAESLKYATYMHALVESLTAHCA
jgi:hypothetical protein